MNTFQHISYKADNTLEFCVNVANQHLDQIITWANADVNFGRIDVSFRAIYVAVLNDTQYKMSRTEMPT